MGRAPEVHGCTRSSTSLPLLDPDSGRCVGLRSAHFVLQPPLTLGLIVYHSCTLTSNRSAPIIPHCIEAKCIVSPDVALPRISLHCIALQCIAGIALRRTSHYIVLSKQSCVHRSAPHHNITHRIAPHRLAMHCVASYCLTTHYITSH